MNPARSPVPRPDPPVSRSVLLAMLVILVTIALVALYAGIQRLRREHIEQATVTPLVTPTPAPAGQTDIE